MPYTVPSMVPNLISSFGNAYLRARRGREQDTKDAVALAFQKSELARRQGEQAQNEYLDTLQTIPPEQRQEFAQRVPFSPTWRKSVV